MKDPPRPSLARLAAYFLRLGALGFGGPAALADYMRRDLVEQRHWISTHEYETGLAIAAACPGPLAYQLAVYCGYARHGLTGALAVAVAFALVPFLLVVAAAAAYARFGDQWALRALFYGVGPVVVALILKACLGLGRKTLGGDGRAWAVAGAACAVTLALERELTELFLGAGFLGIFLFAEGKAVPAEAEECGATPQERDGGARVLAAAVPLGLATAPSAQLFLFFFKTGCLVFGSGLVIVPFLKGYVVDQYRWLGERAFLDAVAIGMISPGPVVITATFVGYLVGGMGGAVAATLGIFTPAVLFTVAAAPFLRRRGHHPRLRGFIRGITVAVVGVLLGTTGLVARSAIGDGFSAAIALLAVAVALRAPRVPDPALVAAGAVLGLAAYPVLRPDWLLARP